MSKKDNKMVGKKDDIVIIKKALSRYKYGTYHMIAKQLKTSDVIDTINFINRTNYEENEIDDITYDDNINLDDVTYILFMLLDKESRDETTKTLDLSMRRGLI